MKGGTDASGYLNSVKIRGLAGRSCFKEGKRTRLKVSISEAERSPRFPFSYSCSSLAQVDQGKRGCYLGARLCHCCSLSPHWQSLVKLSKTEEKNVLPLMEE